VQLLKAGAAIPSSQVSQDAEITLLVTELDRLPLAVTQTAAYIKQHRITVRTACWTAGRRCPQVTCTSRRWPAHGTSASLRLRSSAEGRTCYRWAACC
jgi:hypothetical protein